MYQDFKQNMEILKASQRMLAKIVEEIFPDSGDFVIVNLN